MGHVILPKRYAVKVENCVEGDQEVQHLKQVWMQVVQLYDLHIPGRDKLAHTQQVRQ